MRYLCLLLLLIAGCSSSKQTESQTGKMAAKPGATEGRVVLYCSVDDVYAKPVIALLEKQTGLRIDALYDTEAAKTAGLANRIRAEAARPQGDVFWSSALLQTLLLQDSGLLEPYASPSAAAIPPAFKGKCWAAPGVRSRLLIWHGGLANPPRSYADLVQPRFKGQVGISNPQFGSASDEAAILGVRWGKARALGWYRSLKANGAKVLPGNSVVAQRVARGELMAGITDTDDYLAERNNGALVASTSEMMVIPGSVAILKNARHPEAARRLVDALLKQETETAFCATMPGVFPTRTAPHVPASVEFPNFDPRQAPEDTARWAGSWNAVRDPLADILLGPEKG